MDAREGEVLIKSGSGSRAQRVKNPSSVLLKIKINISMLPIMLNLKTLGQNSVSIVVCTVH